MSDKIDNDNIDHITDEDNDYYSDDDLFKISSWGADLSFRELITQYEDDELLKPELQRKYVWDKTEASRFIDSILLGLPIPSIFLAKTDDEKMLIVDGYQRIMTVHDFVKGIFSATTELFKLSRSKKINKKWRGKAFAELSDTEQRKIRNTTIHAIIFVQRHPKDNDTSMYQIFERINTSGRTLFPQEIRNCIYQGKFNDLLFSLNANKKWRKLFGSEKEDNRMRDIEYILRFFALNSEMFNALNVERISLKKFLNNFMDDKESKDVKVLEQRKMDFNICIDFLSKTFGKIAFHNISPSDNSKYVNKFSPTIFDSIMIATIKALTNNKKTISDEEKRRKLLLSSEFQELISEQTMNTDNIKKRIDIAYDFLYGNSNE